MEIEAKESVCNHQNLTPLSQSVHIHLTRKSTLASRETESGDFSCGMDDLGRWVKLYEKLMKSAVYQDTHAKSLFIHLLLNAQWQSGVYKAIFNKKEITLNAGQLITGRYRLAEALGEPPSTLRNALKRLKEIYQIVDYTSDSKRTIITILKWDTYQNKEIKKDRSKDNRRTTGGQPEDTNQEYKKVSNKEENKYFGLFWKAYPKKIAKATALKSWDKLAPQGDLFKVIMSAVEAQKQCDQWCKDGGQYIPHPATWLNQKRWEDDLNGYHRESAGDRIRRIAESAKQIPQAS